MPFFFFIWLFFCLRRGAVGWAVGELLKMVKKNPNKTTKTKNNRNTNRYTNKIQASPPCPANKTQNPQKPRGSELIWKDIFFSPLMSYMSALWRLNRERRCKSPERRYRIKDRRDDVFLNPFGTRSRWETIITSQRAGWSLFQMIVFFFPFICLFSYFYSFSTWQVAIHPRCITLQWLYSTWPSANVIGIIVLLYFLPNYCVSIHVYTQA